VLSNITTEGDKAAQLAGRLVFEHSGEISQWRSAAMERLAPALNALAFTTNRKFSLGSLRKIIEWAPGLALRRAVVFHESPLDNRVEPMLRQDFASTASWFLAHLSGPAQSAAMRWYRIGVGADILADQFTYLWFSLEIAAQSLKDPSRKHSQCPKCRGPLYCESCKAHPSHRPYPSEAIQQVVDRVHPEGGQEVFATLQKIRHTLLHGGTLESISKELPCSVQDAVETLARITHGAIGLMFVGGAPDPDEELHLGSPDTVVRQNAVVCFHVTTALRAGDPDNPRIEDFPEISITLDYLKTSGDHGK
jgi:hypothetical protein